MTVVVARRGLRLACLIFAAEVIFSLPFHLPRFFRTTLLAKFGLSNTALGDIFALYGLMAMLAYFPGGLLADRYPLRALLAGSLAATAAGGLYLATIPGVNGLRVLYGYWGITTILLFWAALIRATRVWGGALTQGRAFGLLEGGRGLVAAVLGSLAMPLLVRGGAAAVALDLVAVIYFYTAATALAAVLVWICIPATETDTEADLPAEGSVQGVLTAPVIWWQAVVVIAAYCGYKGLDYYALFAQQALGLNEVEAARWFALSAYLRPVAAIVAGLCADRIGIARLVTALFGFGSVAYVLCGLPAIYPAFLLSASLLLTLAGVYALRGVYFALLQESGVTSTHTGTAIGLISVVGYTPDVFFAPLAGRLLDGAPGSAGFQHVFLLLGGIFALGAVAAWRLRARALG